MYLINKKSSIHLAIIFNFLISSSLAAPTTAVYIDNLLEKRYPGPLAPPPSPPPSQPHQSYPNCYAPPTQQAGNNLKLDPSCFKLNATPTLPNIPLPAVPDLPLPTTALPPIIPEELPELPNLAGLTTFPSLALFD